MTLTTDTTTGSVTTFHPAFCGLFPHPPIVVPAVGRERVEECRPTLDACRVFARRLLAAAPARVFVVSPHSPRQRRSFGLFAGDRLRGDLGQFGAPGAAVELPNDPEALGGVERAAAERGVGVWTIPPQPLDHGALIPLWFLAEAGWEGPTTVASIPWTATPEDFADFGRAVAAALAPLPGRSALVASGDMSHRAKPGAPAGYHPRAVEFDRALTELVGAGHLDRIPHLDPELRELAAEDAADTSIIAAAALGFQPHGAEVLSYEHPFGVGYLVAVFHDGGEG